MTNGLPDRPTQISDIFFHLWILFAFADQPRAELFENLVKFNIALLNTEFFFREASSPELLLLLTAGLLLGFFLGLLSILFCLTLLGLRCLALLSLLFFNGGLAGVFSLLGLARFLSLGLLLSLTLGLNTRGFFLLTSQLFSLFLLNPFLFFASGFFPLALRFFLCAKVRSQSSLGLFANMIMVGCCLIESGIVNSFGFTILAVELILVGNALISWTFFKSALKILTLSRP